MFASDHFAPGLKLLFSPDLFLDKFKEIEPEKFPKFSLPRQKTQLDDQQTPTPSAFMQSREFYDSLNNLWKRTMAAEVGEQFTMPPPRLYLCENPFEDFVEIIERLRHKRHQNIGIMPPMINDKWINTSLIISSLIGSERKIQRFHSSLRMFNADFMEQFELLTELLQFGDSFVSNVDKFTKPVLMLDDETMYTAKNLFLLLQMDFVTFIELFKMLSVFSLLEIEDQACLVNSLAVSLLGLCERYHSSRWKAETVVKLSNGFCPIFIFFKNPHFSGEEMRKANLVYCRTMKCFNKVQPTIEEYLLLRAIVMSHSAFDGLSVQAQRLLQKEAERYANALLQFVQTQHGDLSGAKRYAELLELVEGVFYVAAKQRQVHSLLLAKTRHVKGQNEAKMPRAFGQMCFDRPTDWQRNAKDELKNCPN